MSALECLRQIISEEGPIPISEFMKVALYHQTHGYYTNNIPINKDFITAPEISQLFGEVIAIWVIDTWEKLGKPKSFILVEAGAGLGTMMSDILRVIKKFPKLYSILDVYIIEISPTLICVQKRILINHMSKMTWVNKLEDLPKKQMIFLANEFFDSMPTDQYVFIDNFWYERKVTFSPNISDFNKIMLNYCDIKLCVGDLPYFLPLGKKLSNGSIIENSRCSKKIVDELKNRIYSFFGAALIIDYGYLQKPYYSTLQSVKNNKYSEIFADVGESDITALVDFGNFNDFSIMTQMDFLFNFGIKERLDILIRCNKDKEEGLISEFERLTSITQMGELFKVATIIYPL